MSKVRRKKVLLSLLCGFSLITQAYAKDALEMNQNASGFGGSLTALYLQPNANNLDYAVYTTPLPLPAPNWYQQSIKPDYSGAFALGLEYNFTHAENQVKLDWLHFQNSDAASFIATEPNTSVGPSYYFGPAEQFLLDTKARSTAKFNIDQINLTYRQFIHLKHNLGLGVQLGASAAHLKENISNSYEGRDPVFGRYSHQVYTDSKLSGFGPRLEVDGQYLMNHHFGIHAGVGSSLLVSRLSNSTRFTSWTENTDAPTPTNSTPANTQLANQRQTVVVPELDSDLGIFYTTSLKHGGTLRFQLGYLFKDYINAIYQVLPSSLVPGAWEDGTVAIISQSQNQSDLSINGPYIKLIYR